MKPRICFVMSSPMTAEAFLADHIDALSAEYEVHLIANSPPAWTEHPKLRSTVCHHVPIARPIMPIADAIALLELARALKRGKYASVHSMTPKAGLLTATAAFAVGVPVRIHTFTGQVWATRRGLARWGLRLLDRIIAKLCTHVMVDSLSQRDFLLSEGVLSGDEGLVLGQGSVCGVDPTRFRPDATVREAVRAQLGIPSNAVVLLFVGRLTQEKGVVELVSAFCQLAGTRKDLYLVMVGPDEQNVGAVIAADYPSYLPQLRFTGQSAQPERYMACADIFCLPSYREGFGSVIIEAAATGLPAVASRIYGITDAVVDRATGLLVEPRNIPALKSALSELADDAPFRVKLGTAARARALRDFSSVSVAAEFLRFYRDLVPPLRSNDARI